MASEKESRIGGMCFMAFVSIVVVAIVFALMDHFGGAPRVVDEGTCIGILTNDGYIVADLPSDHPLYPLAEAYRPLETMDPNDVAFMLFTEQSEFWYMDSDGLLRESRPIEPNEPVLDIMPWSDEVTPSITVDSQSGRGEIYLRSPGGRTIYRQGSDIIKWWSDPNEPYADLMRPVWTLTFEAHRDVVYDRLRDLEGWLQDIEPRLRKLEEEMPVFEIFQADQPFFQADPNGILWLDPNETIEIMMQEMRNGD